jgi:hypothetical protein
VATGRESKDPYTTQSLSPGAFFDGAKRGVCFGLRLEREPGKHQIPHGLKAIRDDNTAVLGIVAIAAYLP